MRNGDHLPSRLDAQRDAADMIVNHCTRSHPESTVGILSMSSGTGRGTTTGGAAGGKSGGDGGGVELLVSPTDDVGKVLGAVHRLSLPGSSSTGSTSTVSSSISTPSGYGVPSPSGSGAGGADVATAVRIAGLALKHRRNKNGRQRVILFVGSPLVYFCDEDGGDNSGGNSMAVAKSAMTRAGRQLKKNNVSIDVVVMGEEVVRMENNGDDNNDGSAPSSVVAGGPLADLVNAADGGSGTCHLVTVPAGVAPRDVLTGSPVLGGGGSSSNDGTATGGASNSGGGGTSGGGAGGETFADFGGVDPNMDPELAMALRVSMEEERARQERQNAAANTASGGGDDSGGTTVAVEASAADGDSMEVDIEVEATTPVIATPVVTTASSAVDTVDEDALLQQALAMSMAEATGDTTVTATSMVEGEDDDDSMDEEMKMALRLSMQEQPSGSSVSGEAAGDAEEKTSDVTATATAVTGTTGGPHGGFFQDPAFVDRLLGSLPGVDPNDPAVRDVLRGLGPGEGKEDEGGEGKEQEEKGEGSGK